MFHLPDAACSVVSANSNLISVLSADLHCLGLPVGLALFGGELPVDDMLIVRLRICTRGRAPTDAPLLTGMG